MKNALIAMRDHPNLRTHEVTLWGWEIRGMPTGLLRLSTSDGPEAALASLTTFSWQRLRTDFDLLFDL